MTDHTISTSGVSQTATAMLVPVLAGRDPRDPFVYVAYDTKGKPCFPRVPVATPDTVPAGPLQAARISFTAAARVTRSSDGTGVWFFAATAPRGSHVVAIRFSELVKLAREDRDMDPSTVGLIWWLVEHGFAPVMRRLSTPTPATVRTPLPVWVPMTIGVSVFALVGWGIAIGLGYILIH